MLLRLGLKHGHFAGSEEAEHGAEGVPISVDEDPVFVHRQFVAARKHSSER